jgi:autotransporter-associated beta strand protein
MTIRVPEGSTFRHEGPVTVYGELAVEGQGALQSASGLQGSGHLRLEGVSADVAVAGSIGFVTVSEGATLGGKGPLAVGGQIMIRSGRIAFDGTVADPIPGAKSIYKLGYGMASLEGIGESPAPITVEQGTLRVGALGSTAGLTTVSGWQDACLELAEGFGIGMEVLDDIHLVSSEGGAMGFSHGGGLVASTRVEMQGNIVLGYGGGTIGFAGTGLDEVIRLHGTITGESLEVVGTGRLSVLEGGHECESMHIGIHGRPLVALQDRGALPGTTWILVDRGATLLAENTESKSDRYLPDRIRDDASVLLAGGTLRLTGRRGAAVEERVGEIVADRGAARLEVKGDEGDGAILLVASELRVVDRGTIDFDGVENVAYYKSPRVQLLDPPALRQGILGGWATTSYEDFATYDAAEGLGVLPLRDRVPRPSDLNASGPSDHVVLASGPHRLTGDRTIASLILNATGSVVLDLGGFTLNVTTGGILEAGASTDASRISSGTITSSGEGSAGAICLIARARLLGGRPSLEISAGIADGAGGALDLVSAGEGTIALSGTNTYTGATSVQRGELLVQAPEALPSRSLLQVDGGTLTLDMSPAAPVRVSGLELRSGGIIQARRGASCVLEPTGPMVAESGEILVPLSGSARFTARGPGRVSLSADNRSFAGQVQVADMGTLIAGSTSSMNVPYALGLGPVDVTPGCMLVHSTTGALFANLQVDGQLGVHLSSGPPSWRFDGGVYAMGSGIILLLVDALTGQEYPGAKMEFSGPVKLFDGTSLEIRGSGTIELQAGLLVEGGATIVAADPPVVLEGTIKTLGEAALLDLSAAADLDFRGSIDLGQGGLALSIVKGEPDPVPIAGEGRFLAGAGTLTTNVEIQGGAELRPGSAGPGRLVVDGSVTFGPDGVYVWKIQDPDDWPRGGAGTGWDLLDVQGTEGAGLRFASTPERPFVIRMVSLGPTGEEGPLAGFEGTEPRTWAIAFSPSEEGFQPGLVLVDATKFIRENPRAAEGTFSTYWTDAVTPGGFFLDYSPGAQPDTSPPVLRCPEDITASCTQGDGAVVTFEARALDLYDPAPKVECTPPSGSLFATGDTRVQCVATDRGGNVTRCAFSVAVECGSGGQVPGDCTQDGAVGVEDAICLLGFLFNGAPDRLPCGDGSWSDPANTALEDWNGSGRIDIADAVALLFRLYHGGPPHILGEERQIIPGCP